MDLFFKCFDKTFICSTHFEERPLTPPLAPGGCGIVFPFCLKTRFSKCLVTTCLQTSPFQNVLETGPFIFFTLNIVFFVKHPSSEKGCKLPVLPGNILLGQNSRVFCPQYATSQFHICLLYMTFGMTWQYGKRSYGAWQ